MPGVLIHWGLLQLWLLYHLHCYIIEFAILFKLLHRFVYISLCLLYQRLCYNTGIFIFWICDINVFCKSLACYIGFSYITWFARTMGLLHCCCYIVVISLILETSMGLLHHLVCYIPEFVT